MRKVLLVLALIGASFAGGAVVNGPGLTYLKGLIAEHLHRSETIPTLDLENGPAVAIDSTPTLTEPSAKDTRRESTTTPSKAETSTAPILESQTPQNQTPSHVDPPPPLTLSTPTLADPPPIDTPEEPKPLLHSPAIGTNDPVDQPPKLVSPAESINQPPKLVSPAESNNQPPKLVPPTESNNQPPKLISPPRSGWEDAPGPTPATAVLPGQKVLKDRSPASDPAVATATNPNSSGPRPLAIVASPPTAPSPPNWITLKSRMKVLGVTKFWVEGSPNGMVTFRCFVPLDVTAAEGRQFEAEADDEFQAADSALRRVAVWKAAERINKR